MATIKSFTDLKQSRKLAEILPLESADMHWSKDFDGSWFVGLDAYSSIKLPKYATNNVEDYLLPCWSLAVLLNVLPDKICLNDETYYLNCNKKEVKYLGPITCDGQKGIVSASDNLLDGCYKMIKTLHELKLL